MWFSKGPKEEANESQPRENVSNPQSVIQNTGVQTFRTIPQNPFAKQTSAIDPQRKHREYNSMIDEIRAQSKCGSIRLPPMLFRL